MNAIKRLISDFVETAGLALPSVTDGSADFVGKR